MTRRRYRKASVRQELHEENLKRVYDYIHTFIDSHHYPPSFENIGQGCLMSKANVMRYVDFLCALGYIERDVGVPRSISLTDKPFKQ